MKAEQTRGLSAPMADIESPEACVRSAFVADGYPPDEVEHSNLGRLLTSAIRARDAAVRREALEEAAAACDVKAHDVAEVVFLRRSQAIALKAEGKDWDDVFQSECLADSRRVAFRDAAEIIRALAGGSNV